MVLPSVLNALVPKQIVEPVMATPRRKESAIGMPLRDDPSLWRLRSGADSQLDDRCVSDKGDGDPGRPEFPTT